MTAAGCASPPPAPAAAPAAAPVPAFAAASAPAVVPFPARAPATAPFPDAAPPLVTPEPDEEYDQRPTLPSIPAAEEVSPETQRMSVSSARLSSVGRPSGAPWTWSVLHHPGTSGVVRSVAWDGYGRCLAATSEGLTFWNGVTWTAADAGGLAHPQGIRFAQRVGAGRWLVGGDGATLAIYTTGGLEHVFQRGGSPESYLALSGDPDDMGVVAAAAEGGAVTLQTFIGQRWMRAFVIEGMAHVAGLSRVHDERWIVAGRAGGGGGMIAEYAPLEWRLTRLPAPEVRAFLACAASPEQGLGVVAGADGAVLWYLNGEIDAETVDPRFDLSAIALGPDGTTWAASARRIWRRPPAPPGTGVWTCVWAEDAAVAPIVSLFVDAGVVLVVTADGGVLEGRAS